MKHDAHKREPTIKPMAVASKPTLFSSAQEDALVEALFASIGDGAIATDEFGKVMRINAVALQILGYRKTEILGQWFPRLVVAFNDDDKQVEIIDRAITRAFLTGKAISEKTNFQRKNGQKVPISENVSTIILEGKPIGAIVIFRDITLEHEVDRMKSDFVSLASHQLRTPLSSINMYSQMLSAGYMGELTEQQRIPLQTIVESADRMSQLINTLLNVTRIENGTIVVHHKHIDMSALVEEVIKDLRPDATNKEIDLEFHAKNQRILVNTDRLIMQEILSNLVSNAIKYTSKNGSVTISLRLRNRQAVFSVADTGVGIPRYSQDKIFSKFFRAPNVMQRETTGTGLGLYLVKGMADQLGASVWFESELGKGSTFYLSLPAIT
jgi:PAS domain S-box-containing protein